MEASIFAVNVWWSRLVFLAGTTPTVEIVQSCFFAKICEFISAVERHWVRHPLITWFGEQSLENMTSPPDETMEHMPASLLCLTTSCDSLTARCTIKAPSHQASASTDGYVPQHFRYHATSMLSVHKPFLLPIDDIGDSTLGLRNVYAMPTLRRSVNGPLAEAHSLIFEWDVWR